ncbi:MAG TPA: ATP-binding protein [Terriglobales bacterium]|nr:ATP-binding protein [Terriglobales bacterium]
MSVAIRFAACAALLFIVVWLYTRAIRVNPTTVALTFLISVLVVSALWGLRYALFTAFVATAAFNYYFLPPIGTFTIAGTQNWIALLAFLTTAVIASQLSDRARKQTAEAVSRRRELERLYSFSQLLLTADNVLQLLNEVPQHVIDCFGVAAAAVYVPERGNIYRSGIESPDLNADQIKSIIARGEPMMDRERSVSFAPLKMGVRTVGAIGVAGYLSRQTLDAMGSLIAIAVERANAVETLTRSETTREGEKLRSAILDSVTHEFRTPLTSIKASITSLMSTPGLSADDRQELMTVINEESDRLNRLIGEAAEVAQLESHEFQLDLQACRFIDLVHAALADVKQVLGKHPVDIHVPESITVRLDADRIKEVLVQLLENAAKYSAPESPIHITAELKPASLDVSVADQGAGIDDMEQALIFDKFYRGKNQRYRVQGTGMGLAIVKAIVEAHGGKIGVTSQLRCGSVFHIVLPMQA